MFSNPGMNGPAQGDVEVSNTELEMITKVQRSWTGLMTGKNVRTPIHTHVNANYKRIDVAEFVNDAALLLV